MPPYLCQHEGPYARADLLSPDQSTSQLLSPLISSIWGSSFWLAPGHSPEDGVLQGLHPCGAGPSVCFLSTPCPSRPFNQSAPFSSHSKPSCKLFIPGSQNSLQHNIFSINPGNLYVFQPSMQFVQSDTDTVRVHSFVTAISKLCVERWWGWRGSVCCSQGRKGGDKGGNRWWWGSGRASIVHKGTSRHNTQPYNQSYLGWIQSYSGSIQSYLKQIQKYLLQIRLYLLQIQ